MAQNHKNPNGGRPRKELDWQEFEKLCEIQCSLGELAAWFHCTPNTIQRKVKEHYGLCFNIVFQEKRANGLISLRRTLFHHAERNVAAAIFLSKNLLGMSDRQEVAHSGGDKAITIKVVYDD